MPNDKNFKEPERQSLFDDEEEVLGFWKKNRIFEKSLEKNPKEKTFSFYDGPPFITGLPHYATLLPSIAKDIIPRYQTMKGNYVPRVWGWDVHGLPAENKVEEQLGLKVKGDIEEYGIREFVEAARKYVSESSEQWRWYIDHIGRWVDMDNAYRTDNIGYMESVIWVFKELYNKGLIYKGHRVFLYCPRCATVVSKFEVTMDTENYKDVEDPAITVAFKLKGEENTYALAWTTTPWTLPANICLAVNPDIKYVKISNGEKSYILAEAALKHYPEFSSWEKKETFSGKELEGKSFEPLFEPNITPDPEKDYKIYAADFPTTDEGTSVVHIAPAFGEEDFNFGAEKSLSVPIILDDDGKFADSVPWPWRGIYFKDADPQIMDALEEKGLLVKKEKITHSYPHCYRCSTPLIYMAQDSWLFKIDEVRKQLIKTNKDINWVPKHFGDKRFAYNIETAPDWSISRTRYWGIPIPIWETEDGERIVVGSIKEIEKMSGQKVTDLHRPYIDEVVLKTPSGKEAHRVKEVLDVWFESGAMPYAQDHYPFENKEKFENEFPSDFITEYTGQLRGWFYYLHVLANVLKKSAAFKNVVVTGVLMGTDGRKMSKSYGNYPDPRKTLEKYGAESLRLYFMGNKIMNGEDLNLNEGDIRDQYGLLNILHNTHRYFITYANLHNWTPSKERSDSSNVLDKWIIARLEEFISEYGESLDKFEFVQSTRAIRPFIEDLSTWYIRRSRNRFAEGDIDAISTLYKVLMRFSLAVAPTLPFTAEKIYRSLAKDGSESVHLCDYPEADKKIIKKSGKLLEEMKTVRQISSAAHSIRAEIEQPIRQKLGLLVIKKLKPLDGGDNILDMIKEEANVSEVAFNKETEESFKCTPVGDAEICLDTKITDDLKRDGIYRELTRALQDARKKAGLKVGQLAILSYSTRDDSIKSIIEERSEDIKNAAHFSEIRDKGGDTQILGGKLSVSIEA